MEIPDIPSQKKIFDLPDFLKNLMMTLATAGSVASVTFLFRVHESQIKQEIYNNQQTIYNNEMKQDMNNMKLNMQDVRERMVRQERNSNTSPTQ